MMTNLQTFLISMAEDPRRQHDFFVSPDAVLAESGLSDAEQALLLSGNDRAIAAALAARDEEAITASTFADPGPDPMPDPDPPPPPPDDDDDDAWA